MRVLIYLALLAAWGLMTVVVLADEHFARLVAVLLMCHYLAGLTVRLERV